MAGKLQQCAPVLRGIESRTDPLALAWADALRGELYFVAPRHGRVMAPAHFGAFVSESLEVRHAALHGLSSAARACLLSFDGIGLKESARLASRLCDGLDDEGQLTVQWLCALAGLHSKAPSDHEGLDDVGRRASRAGLAALVVDVQSTRALLAAQLGDVAEALALGRRASMMARSEGLPRAEMFAYLALARARRLAHQPHLALRILQALAPLLGEPWRLWGSWERIFAGVTADPNLQWDTSASSPAGAAVREVLTLITAAGAGDRARVERARHALLDDERLLRMVQREGLELASALLPEGESPSPALADFCAGRTVLTPPSLNGLRMRDDGEEGSAQAYVVLEPGGVGRRILHLGAGLVDDSGLQRVPQSHRTKGRVETLLSVLALAGIEGLEEAECFREVYGFAFVPELHRSVFDVLQHRARSALEAGSVDRALGSIKLSVTRRTLIPDPRVCQRVTDRVLRILADRGTASAKDAAQSLGISLRAAQGALAELSTAGACEPRRDGRHVAYVLEDTVFSEPTHQLAVDRFTEFSLSRG